MSRLNCKQLDKFTRELKGLYNKLNLEHSKIHNKETIDLDEIESLKKAIEDKIDKFYNEIEIPYVEIEGNKYKGFYITTTGKTGSQLKKELEDKKIQTTQDSRFMLQSPEFIVTKEVEKIPAICLSVRKLFSDDNNHTYSETLARAFELGLDYLPHEVAANISLNKKNQPELNKFFVVVSKPIRDQHGYLGEFSLETRGSDLILDTSWANPRSIWEPDNELVFAVYTQNT